MIGSTKKKKINKRFIVFSERNAVAFTNLKVQKKKK